nr:MAG TPA: hypothetical protein [Caudoviricetes sp.]
MKTKKAGRPQSQNKRVRRNIAILDSIHKIGAKNAFECNLSFSRYIENLILADIAKEARAK